MTNTVPETESKEEKKSSLDVKKETDTKVFTQLDHSTQTPIQKKAEESVQAVEKFQLDTLGNKVDAQKIKTEMASIGNKAHNFVKEIPQAALSGVQGTSFGLMTYAGLRFSQMFLNTGKSLWYGLRTLGAWGKNILHYLSFKYINKAQSVEKPKYFTYADILQNHIGAKGFAVGGAVGGVGSYIDILGKSKAFFSRFFGMQKPQNQENTFFSKGNVPFIAKTHAEVISHPNHLEIQNVGESIGMPENVIKSAVYIIWREMTGESDPFIRTKSNPKNDNSTAYGPMQLTKSLADIYFSRHSSLFSEEEKIYLQKFIAQGQKMNSVEMDNHPLYGYGKKGEPYFYSAEGKKLYYQVCLKIWQQHIKQAGGNIEKALEIWRGRDSFQDPRYFRYLQAFMKK